MKQRIIMAGACCVAMSACSARAAPVVETSRVYSEEELRAMTADMSVFLSQMVQRQQDFFRNEGRFSTGLPDLGMPRPSGFDVRITEATERGWAAEAVRPSPRIACSVYDGVVGSLPQPINIVTSQAGRPYCAYNAPDVPAPGTSL